MLQKLPIDPDLCLVISDDVCGGNNVACYNGRRGSLPPTANVRKTLTGNLAGRTIYLAAHEVCHSHQYFITASLRSGDWLALPEGRAFTAAYEAFRTQHPDGYQQWTSTFPTQLVFEHFAEMCSVWYFPAARGGGWAIANYPPLQEFFAKWLPK